MGNKLLCTQNRNWAALAGYVCVCVCVCVCGHFSPINTSLIQTLHLYLDFSNSLLQRNKSKTQNLPFCGEEEETLASKGSWPKSPHQSLWSPIWKHSPGFSCHCHHIDRKSRAEGWSTALRFWPKYGLNLVSIASFSTAEKDGYAKERSLNSEREQ